MEFSEFTLMFIKQFLHSMVISNDFFPSTEAVQIKITDNKSQELTPTGDLIFPDKSGIGAYAYSTSCSDKKSKFGPNIVSEANPFGEIVIALPQASASYLCQELTTGKIVSIFIGNSCFGGDKNDMKITTSLSKFMVNNASIQKFDIFMRAPVSFLEISMTPGGQKFESEGNTVFIPMPIKKGY